MLLSDFGITNWKDVTVFYPLVEHSKIQHLHVFLGYPVFLAFLFLCVMCNTQKMTKWQTSALRNAFIPYLCYFFLFCFLLIFSLRRWCFLTISDFCTLCSYSAYEKNPESFCFSLPCACFMEIFVPKYFLSLPAQNLEAWWLLCLYVF